jgi:adenine/guanine/hypoxanthine permease
VAVVCGALFFPFMFFAPLIGMVPLQAVAPALIIVGYLMVTALSEYEEEAEPGPDGTTTRRVISGIDFNNLALGLAALLTIVIMPFTYSITNGSASASSPTPSSASLRETGDASTRCST